MLMQPILSSAMRILAAALLLTACPGPDPLLPDGAGYLDVPATSLPCEGNNDGIIELSELSFHAGISASYRVNPPQTVARVKSQGALEEGWMVWDHSSLEGIVARVTLEPVEGKWFEERFAGASFALGTDVEARTLQVLQLDPDQGRLLLMGLVSSEPDRTLMIYQPPIEVLRFPLRKGLSFSSSGLVENGVLDGLPVATRDSYQIEVDEEGTVRLPSLDLRRSLRVKLKATVTTLGGREVYLQQQQWFHECMGEVVRVVAQPGSDGSIPEEELQEAIEYRRLSF